MGDNFDNSQSYPRYWLITAPRTASNLLVTMLNLEEQNVGELRHGGYFFMRSVMTRFPLYFAKGPIETWPEQDRNAVDNVSREVFDTVQDHIEATEKAGKTIFVKEHALFMTDPRIESQYMFREAHAQNAACAPTGQEELSVLPARGIARGSRSRHNWTVFPDEFLHTITPIFLIRHPALMIPSYYRSALDQVKIGAISRPDSAGGGPSEVEGTIRWNRALYDFYAESFAASGRGQPIVLDADDVMTSGAAIVPKYASLVGLDPSKTRTSWEKGSLDDGTLKPVEKRMLSTLLDTSEVDKSKIAGKDIDITTEAVKWREEFGDEAGRKIERWVREAMPHYEHMRQGRLMPDSDRM
ncbi:hypothetical protein Micbo1qcDRAFT_169020 [Microdochium bolleyi]|uniref:P-loop containing nucleoside triphosphate hydrolase protein n=1 Tax=Microdochium bolleyi TaxID=196109 RepID=A0A136ILZ8_9PEZI|nr:hypothetical protein Micbo1qcDRAFT_169020 [Microdochium bolleyi]